MSWLSNFRLTTSCCTLLIGIQFIKVPGNFKILFGDLDVGGLIFVFKQ